MRSAALVLLICAAFAATGPLRSVLADEVDADPGAVVTGEENSTVGIVEGGPTGEALDEHADEHAHDYTRPPLNFEPQLAIWSLVVFVLFLLISRPLIWKPLMAGLNAREDRINRALAEAQAARKRAEQLIREHEQRMAAAHEEVRGIVASARREAEQARTEIIAAAESEAEQIRDRAVAEIAAAREQLLAELSVTADRYAETTSTRLLEGMRT